MNILVVDDDEDIRHIALLALGPLGGFDVTLAAGGEEALVAIARRLPDVVLLDVSMPGMDGPATLAALQASPHSRTIPVIFFTATTSETEIERLRTLGAVGVVAKPFDLARLGRRIHDILEAAAVH
jgi:two-component system, OmpR family, response regulator